MKQLAKIDTNHLRVYFGRIVDLKRSGEKFPVSFDEVYPLVYGSRAKALSTLKDSFIEGIDFQLYQMGKVVSINELQNGVKTDAKLSSDCMEYFIARKVREAAIALNQKLHEKGVQHFSDKHWVLYAKYQDKGFTKTRTHTYYNTEGKQMSSVQTVWTEKGRMFIHELLKPDKLQPTG